MINLRDNLLRTRDTLVIKELDRLGRNMDMVKEKWNALTKNDIDIIVLDTPMLNTKGKDTLEKNLINNYVLIYFNYMILRVNKLIIKY